MKRFLFFFALIFFLNCFQSSLLNPLIDVVQRMIGSDTSLIVSFELALVMVIYLGIHGEQLPGLLLAYWCGYLTDLDRPLAYGFYTVLYLFVFLLTRFIADKFRIQTMLPTLILLLGASIFEQLVSFTYYWLTPWTHVSFSSFIGVIGAKIFLNGLTTLLIFPLFQFIDAFFSERKSVLPF